MFAHLVLVFSFGFDAFCGSCRCVQSALVLVHRSFAEPCWSPVSRGTHTPTPVYVPCPLHQFTYHVPCTNLRANPFFTPFYWYLPCTYHLCTPLHTLALPFSTPHATIYNPCTPCAYPCTPMYLSHLPIMHVPCALVTLPTPLHVLHATTPVPLGAYMVVSSLPLFMMGEQMGEVLGGAAPPSLQQSPICAPTRVDMLAKDSAAMHVRYA